jgi:hypothetical protein
LRKAPQTTPATAPTTVIVMRAAMVGLQHFSSTVSRGFLRPHPVPELT